MQATKLQKEILKTLLFFNLHNRPLALKEMHQFLGIKANEAQVFLALMNLVKKNKVVEKNQYFVLKNYAKILRSQKTSELIKEKLIKKAKLFSLLFRITPFVRGVFLANSLAMGMPKKTSDIDVVVLVKKGWLWIVRFILNLLFLFLGQRRRKKIKKDPEKFCLSFFAECKTNLQFEKLTEDPLLIYWLATLQPLIGSKAEEMFLRENGWISNFLPNRQLVTIEGKIKALSFLAFLGEKIINLCGNWLEKYLFQIQARSIKAKNKKDTKLALPYIYRSYPNGERKKFLNFFNKNYKNLLLNKKL